MIGLSSLKTITMAAMIAAGSLTITACEEKSPMEEAAEDAKEAAEEMKDALDN